MRFFSKNDKQKIQRIEEKLRATELAVNGVCNTIKEYEILVRTKLASVNDVLYKYMGKLDELLKATGPCPHCGHWATHQYGKKLHIYDLTDKWVEDAKKKQAENAVSNTNPAASQQVSAEGGATDKRLESGADHEPAGSDG